MKNKLQRYLARVGRDPVEAMNALQDHGIISDLAVMPEDVVGCDIERARDWLMEHPPQPE